MSARMQNFLGNSLMLINIVGQVSWLFYAFIFVGLIFKNDALTGPWVIFFIQGLNLTGVATIVVAIFLSLVSSTRGISGLLGVAASKLFVLAGSLTALIVVFSGWGLWATLIGSVFLGIGILPVGIIYSLLVHNYQTLFTLLQYAFFIALGQYGGLALMATTGFGQDQTDPKPEMTEPQEMWSPAPTTPDPPSSPK